MTLDKLERGLAIQDELGTLKTQLTRMNKTEYTVLSDLRHPCSRELTEIHQGIEEEVKTFIFKLLNTRVALLEKEFKKL